MSGKGEKSKRRASTHGYQQAADGEVPEGKIKCKFCDKSVEDINHLIFLEKLPEKDYDRWVQCTDCGATYSNGWMHLRCLDDKLGKCSTVNDTLWDKIGELQEWRFTCPDCGEFRPIPAQLEFQNIFSRAELLAMDVSEELLLKQMPRDIRAPTDRETESESGESDTEDTKVFTVDPGASTSQNVLLNDNVAQQHTEGDTATGSAVVMVPPPVLTQNPVSAPGGFDMTQILTFMQKQQESFVNKFFDDKEKERQRETQERDKDRRERDKDREARERKDALDREERHRKKQQDREEKQRKEELDRQDRELWREMFQSSAASINNNSAIARTSSKPANLKLPKVQLPRFDGTILKWPEFWDLYENMVHNNDDLPKIQKLSFLKQALTGSAASVIASYKITEDNYDAVIQKLKDRYDNKAILREQLYSQLHSLPVSGSKGTELRKTYDVITSICTQFKNLGQTVDDDLSLLYTVMQKFPISVKQELEKRKGEEADWNLELFLRYLESHIKILEKMWISKDLSQTKDFSQTGSNSSFGEKRPQRFGKPNMQTPYWESEQAIGRGSGAGLLTAKNVKSNFPGTVSKSQQRFPCVYCNNPDHYADQCTKVASIDARKKILNDAKRCFVCFGRNHVVRNCSHPRKQKACRGCQIVGAHHESLCEKWYQKKSTEPKATAPNTTNNNNSLLAKSNTTMTPTTPSSSRNAVSTNPSTGMTCVSRAPKSMLQTACVDVINIGIGIPTEVKVLLDSGSNSTWISKDLAERLRVRYIGEKMVPVSTFYNPEPNWVRCYEAELELVTKDKGQVPCIVTVIDPLTAPISRQSITSEDKEFLSTHPEAISSLAKGAIAQECAEFCVEMLIGGDYFWQFMTSGDRIDLPSGLQLLPSVFGYLIGGQCPNTSTSTGLLTVNSCFLSTQADEAYFVTNPSEYLPKLSDLWDLEAVGIKDSPTIKDDDRALERFNDTIRFEDGRYQVTWSWKSDDIDLPENRTLAWGRFSSLCRRLKADKDLLKKYDTAIKDQLSKGIVEKVTEESIVGPRKHYLPHHPVITPQKTTTKVRIVYDASAKQTKGANSLNDCLHRGPVILPDLCGLLLRFRTAPIAILADTEKAFLQVGLQMPERDVTRFSWLKDPQIPNPNNNYEIYRFCRVAFGIICSPFLLEATIKYHLDQIGTKLARQISENIYVDNILILADDVESTTAIYAEAKELFHRASMNLREWTSNCPEFLANLPEDDRVKAERAKILGLTWDLNKDTIQVKGFDNQPTPAPTKRTALHAVAKIFDPLGFFNPVLYHGKMFLHRLWLAEKKWDDPLEPELVAEWQRITDILDAISTITIPRYVGLLAVQYELIIFCDASKNVYATAIYLRFPVGEGMYETKLVFSKLRLAARVKNSKTGEKESITITRLELLAVWIGVKTANFVTKELKLPIGKRILFTDSAVVLGWLQSPKTQGTFIQNRLNDIRQAKDIIFRHVRSEDNPADLMTRGLTVPELTTFWWNGPEWLSSEVWPENETVPEFSAAQVDELIANEAPTSEIILSSGEGPAAAGILQNLDLSRFSSFRKLLGTVAYCIRFVTKAKDRIKGLLTGTELQKAENVLVKSVQHTYFSNEFDDLRKNKRSNLKEQLGLYEDENGFLRCCGRIGKADLDYTTKFPRLLPEKSIFTELVVQHAHNQIFHYGDSHTLSQVRLEYWIPHGRRVVRRVLKKCLVCKQVRGGAFKLPPVPVLPKERVLMARPFQYTGVDYMGPIYLRASPNSKEVTKTWICLFTCLVVRAVHLEPVTDLSAKQFINCFRRFVSRRGKPDKVISDNAPNFKLTKKALDQIWARIYTDPECIDNFSKKRIQWTFITEMAPWQGGFYERLVGVVKNALRCGLGKKFYTLEELFTILSEVEAVVNSRPLTFISSGENDSPVGLIITPSHFLGSHQDLGLPELMDDPNDEYVPTLDSKQLLLRYYANEQKILNKFWKSWSNDYLLSLRERPSKHKTSRIHESREPEIGEIVLVKKENLPRGRWLRGRITNLSRRDDGAILNATVQLSGGQTLTRPINHLYSLEIQPNSDEPTIKPSIDALKSDESDEPGDLPKTPDRLPRKAKQMAKARIVKQMRYEDIDDDDFFSGNFHICDSNFLCGYCHDTKRRENCGMSFFCFAGSVAVPMKAGEGKKPTK